MNIWRRSSIRNSSDEYSPGELSRFFVCLCLLFALSFVLAVLFGSTRTGLIEALTSGRDSAAYRIFAFVRLPRVFAAVLAGSALAVSGAMIQAVLNNAMAAPNIIGVNSGAGLAVSLLVAISPSAVSCLPYAAFLGALAACLCIYAIAARTGASRLTITLVGVTISSILTAGINAVKTVFPDSLYNSSAFMVGGISGVSLARLSPACWLIAGGILCAWALAKDIDVLNLGEEMAGSLGMNVTSMRFLLLLLASVLAGSAVSFAGLLGFVGLLVPHICRRFVGSYHRRLIPACALGGASLVLLCDLAARLLFAPYELPVGIILSLVGGPFFLALILVQRKSKIYD